MFTGVFKVWTSAVNGSSSKLGTVYGAGLRRAVDWLGNVSCDCTIDPGNTYDKICKPVVTPVL
ncbi:hypothetical protein DPMN_190389 [Dreissena polymorpha]|uniref:Uncharacterized protein n=1 Tax=Dreissena polymorpha TaxID=45954 RepID=A0A9D4DUK2_DREPO|nr:hypothetical protein DPMN_190389 [Dreissena polymorpha]